MANKVSYIIKLQDRFSAAGRKIKRSMNRINTSSKKLDNSLKSRLSRTLGGLNDKALKAAKGIATLTAVMSIVRVGAGFQDSIAELSAITGATGPKLQSFTSDILRLSKVAGFSQSKVAGAFTQIASAKSELLKNPKELAIVTEQTLLLAKASGISLPDAVKASVGALNQFGAGADQAARFVNVLAAGSKIGASVVGETAEALKNAGTIASQLGLTFESTNAILQVFAKNEVKGAEAGTALRGTLIQLEKLGGRFAPSVVGIDAALQSLAETQFTNTELIEKFGNENLRTALILRKNLPLIRQWTRELTGTSAAAEQAAIRSDTFNESIKKLGITAASIAIAIFTGFEPLLTLIVDLVNAWLKGLEGLLSAAGNFIGQFIGAVFSLDFQQFDILEGVSKFGEAFGEEALKPIKPFGPANLLRSQTDVNVNLRAPEGVIESAKSRTSGKVAGLNVGLNMAAAV